MSEYKSSPVARSYPTPVHVRMRYFPDDAAVLTAPCAPVTNVDDAFIALADAMEELAIRCEGFAVAAPQVGISQRFFVFHHYYARKFGFPSPLILNPTLHDPKGNLRMEESCLSLPGLKGWLDRPETVTVKFSTVQAPNTKRDWSMEVSGIAARVVQHEIDHLDGELFHTKLDKSYSDKVLRYFEKKAGRR